MHEQKVTWAHQAGTEEQVDLADGRYIKVDKGRQDVHTRCCLLPGLPRRPLRAALTHLSGGGGGGEGDRAVGVGGGVDRAIRRAGGSQRRTMTKQAAAD